MLITWIIVRSAEPVLFKISSSDPITEGDDKVKLLIVIQPLIALLSTVVASMVTLRIWEPPLPLTKLVIIMQD